MVERFFHYFVRQTHYWRTVGYAELAELYASRMLRVMALQVVGGFTIIYMYQLGYSLHVIALYFLFYFVLRTLMTPLVAIIVARYGPKHGTLLSNLGQIIGALTLIFLPQFGLLALLIYAPIAGLSRSLYDVCYLVDFSKIKHVEHAGKELGLMQIFERIMTSLGPVIGGVVALFFGPSAMFGFGALLLLLAALPLFFTSEPVKVHQKITLRHFNWRVAWRPSLANIGVGIDMNLSGVVWNIFLALVVLGITNKAIYVQIGGLSSASILTSIACAYIYGKLVDKHHGKLLLRISTIMDVVVHLLRPLVRLPVQAIGINITNDIVTTGYALPATRGVFDTADGLPGYRIVYITLMETMTTIGDSIVMLALVILTSYVSETQSLQWLYFCMAPLILLVLLHAKAVYRRGVLTKFIHKV